MINCINCGTDNLDEAKFCSKCGKGMTSEVDASVIFQQRERQYQEAILRQKEINIKKQANTALILAILGLLFDFIYGLGFILSAISLIYGLTLYSKRKDLFSWSVFLGLLGLVFGLLYFIFMVII